HAAAGARAEQRRATAETAARRAGAAGVAVMLRLGAATAAAAPADRGNVAPCIRRARVPIVDRRIVDVETVRWRGVSRTSGRGRRGGGARSARPQLLLALERPHGIGAANDFESRKAIEPVVRRETAGDTLFVRGEDDDASVLRSDDD